MTYVLYTWVKSLHVLLTMATLEMETCVRGFHVYKAIWEAAVGELECGWEATEWIAMLWQYIVKDETVVGQVVLQKISRMCNWRQWALRVWQLFLSCWSEVLYQHHLRMVRMSSWLTVLNNATILFVGLIFADGYRPWKPRKLAPRE